MRYITLAALLLLTGCFMVEDGLFSAACPSLYNRHNCLDDPFAKKSNGPAPSEYEPAPGYVPDGRPSPIASSP
jgi:hypothetical protein